MLSVLILSVPQSSAVGRIEVVEVESKVDGGEGVVNGS